MHDPRGNPVSTTSAGALAAAEQALQRIMTFYGPPLDDLDEAAAHDPGWLLPPLMKAGFLLSLTEPALVGQARALLDAARPLTGHATQREREHLGALRLLAQGDWAGACRAWETVLLAHPCDALALQWAHLFDFHRGDLVNLRRRVARVLPEWDEDDPLYPHVLALHAFGLEENQLYAAAEETGRRALALDPRAPWAMHAVAHVMEMQGRHAEGAQWLADCAPHWTDGNGFSGHLGWHHALFALETLDAATALQRFDAYLAANPEQITLQRLDAASLLWRLHLLDIDTGARWRALVDGWALGPEQAGHSAFNDAHALLALIGVGDLRGAQAWVQQALQRADALGASHAATAHDVGAPLMRGLLAYARGDDGEVVEALYPLRDRLHRIGGSHAQRDLVDQTLLAAAARGRHGAVGRALLNERRTARAMTPWTEHWARRLATIVSGND
ncbi:MAG: tetratricopeptide repeat protein [Proteobacteria bacterium]|nr:tetratricopeptide repeat protein [Pseudomonadota bacterium]